jgi:hypothetical protein
MVSVNGREITPHLCEMVTKLSQRKDIGGHAYYLLGHIRRPEAEKAQKAARECGYNARIIDDFGTAVYIRKGRK